MREIVRVLIEKKTKNFLIANSSLYNVGCIFVLKSIKYLYLHWSYTDLKLKVKVLFLGGLFGDFSEKYLLQVCIKQGVME